MSCLGSWLYLKFPLFLPSGVSLAQRKDSRQPSGCMHTLRACWMFSEDFASEVSWKLTLSSVQWSGGSEWPLGSLSAMKSWSSCIAQENTRVWESRQTTVLAGSCSYMVSGCQRGILMHRIEKDCLFKAMISHSHLHLVTWKAVATGLG